jgi:tRNA dimethylallyltransferase
MAEALDGSIVNADSRQAYRDFPLITAQPSHADQAICPHVLYAFLDTQEKLSAGRYAALALDAVRTQAEAGRFPILVGGTGFYLRTLLHGIAPIPPVSPEISQAWQQRCAEQGSQNLHALLQQKDPACAAVIHPNDRQRITRALEVLDATGIPLSAWQCRRTPVHELHSLCVYLDFSLEELTPRLTARIDAMLEAGAVDEVRNAMQKCPDPQAPGWSGIGCAEVRRFLNGRISLDQCRDLWIKNTRAYAKRQITWFKRDASLLRVRPDAVRSLLPIAAAHAGKA